MPFTWAALMPHPPVLAHAVGRGREREALRTLDGTERLRAALTRLNAALAPDVLLVLSPHQPGVSDALFINRAARVRGSLARFGAPGVHVSLTGSPAALDEMAAAFKAAGIPCAAGDMPDITPDHGAVVPLQFILPTFPDGKIPSAILAGPSGLSLEHALALGDALRGLPGGRRWALLASGDLSHRLKNDGPYGFDPAGPIFDAAVLEALKLGDPAPLLNLKTAITAGAGECGLRSVLALLRLTRAPLEIFSYEGPFGVGYCNALWTNSELFPSENARTGARGANGQSGEEKGPTPENMQADPGGAAGRRREEELSISEKPQSASRGVPERHREGEASSAKAPQSDRPAASKTRISVRVLPASARARTAHPGAGAGVALPAAGSSLTRAHAPHPSEKAHPPQLSPAGSGQYPGTNPSSARQDGHPYPRLARAAIAALLKGRPAPTPADAETIAPQSALWTPRKGCFVSIKSRDGSLRGCIGTFLPTRSGLAEEITANAVSAATRDPRFPPMRPEELSSVRISVDVLSEPELVRPGMRLDPEVYGVIVCKDGRRGLLLPDLDGIDSVERQVAVAAQKGGIRDTEGAEIYRFTVDRYREGDA
ncbi:MAG: AmmeMemoRadiSam system protein A [Desulfovibrio sp.]|nr:AmmeMemoRadiSam system protein A [Desulfovibrio sp.]